MRRFLKTKVVYIFLAPLFLILLWINFQLVLSIVGNRFFYHIDSPIQVVSVTPNSTYLYFTRTSKIDMREKVLCELHCDEQVFFMPEMFPYLESGYASFYKTYPIPETAKGTCHYKCMVSYAPFGSFGATLKHPYYSTEFTIPESD